MAAALQPRRTVRGFQASYFPGEVCRCPACGARNWQVGRVMAQCGRCETALPIVSGGAFPDGNMIEGMD